MILYKFKSLSNFEQIADSLLGRRLYCPTPSELNDPLEGILGVTIPSELIREGESKFEQYSRHWTAHEEKINQYRVCSFTLEPSSMLMWSFYGGGHSGICIEVDVIEYRQYLRKMNYVSTISEANLSSIENLLTHKLSAWAYEKEYRLIFQSGEK